MDFAITMYGGAGVSFEQKIFTMPNQRKCGLIIDGKDTSVPLRESKVEVTIQGFVASVESTLVYNNDTAEALQTSYIFPMDDMSAVYKFEAHVNNKHIVAECQDKKQAKETYKAAIDEGKTALILSEDDMAGDIFECKLGNLPPGEKALLTISYVVELSVETEGKMRFTLPAVLIPRYSPDVGCYKPPGDEPAPGQVDIKQPKLLTFNARVQGHHKIASVTSTNKVITVDIGEDKQTASIKLAETFKFEHDLSFDVLYQNTNEPEILLELGNKSKDGLLKEDLLMLNFVPQFNVGGEAENSQREFIFVIDRSGSMYDSRIKKARETLLLLLKSLPVGCLFNIVSFGSTHSSLFEKSEEYTESTLGQAIKLQESMDADMGGTEILKPFKDIYSKSCKHGYPRQIFLLTDGGVGNTSDVVKLVSKNKGNTRVFTFGIGDGASTSLIKNVARASNGKAYFIKDNDNMQAKDNDNMQAKVIGAMKSSLEDCLTDVTLKWKLPKCFSVVDIPKEPPCIYNGEKLVLFAVVKCSNNTTQLSGELSLKGVIGGKAVKHKVNIVSDGITCEDLPLHRVAAKYQIKDYECDDEGQYSMRESKNKDKIVSVSIAANIISKYTAFVGVDKETNLAMSVVQDFKVGTYMCVSSPALQCNSINTMCRSAPTMKARYKSSVRSCSPIAKSCQPAPPPPGAKSCTRPLPPRLRGGGSLDSFSYEDETKEEYMYSDEEECDEVSANNVPEKVGLMGIISLQKFDGSWSPSDELQKILNVSSDKLTMKYKGNVWCTAVVLVYISKHFAEKKAEWEMLANKAMKWINANNGDGKNAETIIKEVNDSQIL